MEYRKIFFPIGGGEELRERIHGALLIGKYFNCHLEILKSQAKPSKILKMDSEIPANVLSELNAIASRRLSEDLIETENIFKEEAKKIGNKLSKKAIENTATAEVIIGEGYRSQIIEQESKYCDLVITASPHDGRITATFEATVTKSGKPVLMFPREMTSFNTDKILIGWNNSPQASKALGHAIPLLKKAKEIHLIYSKEYISTIDDIKKIQSYLRVHGIEITYEEIETTKIPGQALLHHAIEGNYDLIVAGAFGHRGLKELMLGGTTKYILEHSGLPIFMAH
ncbi:universal stress protein [Arcobacter sp. CECT 8983]|uniref:universal stress protein n=1 Tax=Arcobacter sp. CECT 8983 TaxID=2044508 RepID=UPI00100AA949|nr:universal stress protein [Arcobacter sp. CECT 8983]RXJ89220.1 universal stress protein [Arcobacter sp. CECT 8983]